MRKIAAAVLLVVGLLAAQGCGTAGQTSAGGGVAIRGEVIATGELPNEKGGSLMLVEGKKEEDTKYEKASVRVPKSAKVYIMEGEKRKKASPADLKSGQRVEIKFTGEVAEADPVQAEAGEVVILNTGA